MTVKQLFNKKIEDFAKRNSTDPKPLHKPKKFLFNIFTTSTTWFNLGVLIKQVKEVLELNMCAWLKQNQHQFYFLYCLPRTQVRDCYYISSTRSSVTICSQFLCIWLAPRKRSAHTDDVIMVNIPSVWPVLVNQVTWELNPCQDQRNLVKWSGRPRLPHRAAVHVRRHRMYRFGSTWIPTRILREDDCFRELPQN